MKNICLTLCAAMLCMLQATSLLGQSAPDTLRTYIFGHSLINHELQVNPTPSNETSVPHWFHLLAAEAGYGYAVSGQYGFLNGHAVNLPPIAQWGFDIVPPAWNDNVESFADADFDNILLTPANFAQWQGPAVPYWQDTLSPITATSMLFDWTMMQEDSLTFYIYENWPDMAPYLNNGFPPSASEWTDYNNYLNGSFHDWFIEYHDSMILRYPNHCVRMIPVGPLISGLVSQSPFDQIAVTTLYEDDAPHGRPNLYFLAGIVTYMSVYGVEPPASFVIPGDIDPLIAERYDEIVAFCWDELAAFVDDEGMSRVF